MFDKQSNELTNNSGKQGGFSGVRVTHSRGWWETTGTGEQGFVDSGTYIIDDQGGV